MNTGNFFLHHQIEPAQEFKVQEIVDANLTCVNIDEYVQQKLVSRLISSMIDRNIVSICKIKNLETSNIVYEAKIAVVRAGEIMQSVKNECFKLNDEIFTKQDITYAVQTAFPERFL